jgi:hypothetical protein
MQSCLLQVCAPPAPGDTGHVRRDPCKDTIVVHEKTGEREFLFGVEVGPDDDFLECNGQAEANLLYSWTWVQSYAGRP